MLRSVSTLTTLRVYADSPPEKGENEPEPYLEDIPADETHDDLPDFYYHHERRSSLG